MWFELLKPLVILITTSILTAITFGDSTFNIIKLFVLASVVQFIVYNAYKQFLILYAEKIKNERIKEFSKQGMDITCPCYLEKKMFIPIELNGINSFNCIECKKDCTVQLIAKTYNKTEVIDLEEADAALTEVYKQIQNTP